MTLMSRVAARLPDRYFCAAIAMAHRRFEPEMGGLIAGCDPLGTAVDVGAWFGPWTYWLARRGETVVALEANPSVARVLRATVRENVTVHEVAVSNASGTVELSITGGGGRGAEGRSSVRDLPDATERVAVTSATLDSFHLDRVRFVKIDVEGHEHAVLEGATALLEQWHPVVVVELEDRYGDIRSSIQLLESLGYEGRVWKRKAWAPLDVDALIDTQRSAQAEAGGGGYLRRVLSRAEYVNNVLFVHPASTWRPSGFTG